MVLYLIKKKIEDQFLDVLLIYLYYDHQENEFQIYRNDKSQYDLKINLFFDPMEFVLSQKLFALF